LIELKGIGRTFQVGTEAVHALQAVDLTVRDGEYLSVMGPSGSGKSTLLNIIGLLDHPDSGVYRLDDVNATGLNDTQQAAVRRHKIGFVFQFFHLVPRLTAAENVELPLILAGVDPDELKKRLRQALEALGIADRARHRPDQLSGGQRQRVAIARATIMRPGIILADEPTGNLDRTSGNDVLDILEDLNKEGKILIMVTHDPELGRRAKRQILMLDGRIGSDSGKSA
jgi:putative ABC transport system ATP-binding protein